MAQDDDEEMPADETEGGVDQAEESNTRQIEEDLANAQKLKPKPRYGVGFRLRYVTIPKFFLEQFWEEVSAGIAQPGFGLDFVRRNGDFELTVGVEYESLKGSDGYWLEKGDDGFTPGETPDFVEFNGLSWVTLDANFVFHKQLNEMFALRYGGGFGLGIIFGEVTQTDSICSPMPDINGGDCMENTAGEQVNDPTDLPPVFPVVNILFGGQFRPVPEVLLNLELGIRTAPFIGFSGQYLF